MAEETAPEQGVKDSERQTEPDAPATVPEQGRERMHHAVMLGVELLLIAYLAFSAYGHVRELMS